MFHLTAIPVAVLRWGCRQAANRGVHTRSCLYLRRCQTFGEAAAKKLLLHLLLAVGMRDAHASEVQHDSNDQIEPKS